MQNTQLKSLQLVLDMERRREDQFAQRMHQARQQCEYQRSRLQGLENYRVEYLNNAVTMGQNGLQSLRFGHYHAFIGKLDEGIGQQRIKLQRLEQVVEDRKNQWLEKQQRRKAIEQLIEQQHRETQRRVQRNEQKTADEYAMQGVLRRARNKR